MALGIFSQICGKNVSGASRIYIADKAVATAFTIVAHEISAVTGTTPFNKVDALQDSVEWTEEGSRVGLNNWSIKNTINFDVMPPSTTTSTFLQALIDGSPCGFFAIIVDGNGKCWLVGHNETDVRERPLRLGKQSQKTGKGLQAADGNTIPITLENECSGKALAFNAAITATILAQTDACLKLT